MDRSSTVFRTPVGWAGVAVSERGIRRIVLPKGRKSVVEQELADTLALGREQGKSGLLNDLRARGAKRSGGMSDTLRQSVALLERYFSGEEVVFDLPLDMGYYTDFQRVVWKAASSIPYGETRSYGWIARRIGKPGVARAVGRAMGANPFPVIIP